MQTRNLFVERDPAEPVINRAFADQLNALHDVDDTLYRANYEYQAALCAAQREAHCKEFDAALQALVMVAMDMSVHLQHMRESITPARAGRVIHLLRRRQPRDSRGRFIKRASLPEED